jgi:uncharacterized protein (DUF2147 family)
MKRVAAVVCVLALAGLVRAEEKPNPTGTWKYSTDRNGQTVETVITLKLDGDKLTGTLKTGDTESKIEDAKYKDGEVSFTVTRERNGNKIATKYTGKITGDTFKGKREFDRNGQTTSRDFEAKREKAK